MVLLQGAGAGFVFSGMGQAFDLGTALGVVMWAMITLAVLLLLWALLWDRSRGRRRCPKCWYSLEGVPGVVCPECGKNAVEDRRLLKTRRRWRWVVVAFVLMVSGYVVGLVPAYRASGIWAVVPRPVLIWMIPEVEPGAGPGTPAAALASQAGLRLLDGPLELAGMWWPERKLLVPRAKRALVAEDSGDSTREFAALLLVLAREDAVDQVPLEQAGPVVLAKTALVYGRAGTYRDRGMVKGSIGIRDEKPFVTAFVRAGPDAPQRFRFEFLSGHPNQRHLAHRFVIWATGDDANVWWTIQPLTQEMTLPLAIASGTGISSSSAYRVPSMLLGDIGGRAFTSRTDVRVAGMEEVGGRRCYRITARAVQGLEAYLIDAERFVLLRVEREGQFPSVTTYEPELDVEIEESWFTFDPERPGDSPLQDEAPPGG